MTEQVGFGTWLAVLAAVSYGCRAGGFWLMRYVPRAERLEAALGQAPMAVMIGIVAPALLRGGVPEFAGFAAVVVAMRVQRSDLLAALAGVAAVAIVRALPAG